MVMPGRGNRGFNRDSSRGFTLVEVMVALVIVAVALPAFLTLVMAQLDGTAAIRDRTLAFWVAENEMTRLHLQQRLLQDYTVPDRDAGEVTLAGLEWRWELETEATEVPGFRQVEVAIAPNRDREAVMARLTGFVRDDD